MTYSLIIGDRAYSSWSLRSWLLLERFGISAKLIRARLYSGDLAQKLAPYPPAKTVPTLVADGVVISDTMAIAEELAARHPELDLWPADPAARAAARMVSAEMHSGFGALRSECPMNLRVAYSDFPVSPAVRTDLARLEAIWAYAQGSHASDGPWLFGSYSIADTVFAPVAPRIAGYGLPVSKDAAAYVDLHLHDRAFRRWRAMSLVDGPDQPTYAMPHAKTAWPGPKPKVALPVGSGPSVNSACPYSGDAVTDFLEMDGKIYGFCNPFCRDKTVSDPEAWPDFMELVASSH